MYFFICWLDRLLEGGSLRGSYPIIRFPMTKYLFHDLTIYLLPGGVDWGGVFLVILSGGWAWQEPRFIMSAASHYPGSLWPGMEVGFPLLVVSSGACWRVDLGPVLLV